MAALKGSTCPIMFYRFVRLALVTKTIGRLIFCVSRRSLTVLDAGTSLSQKAFRAVVKDDAEDESLQRQ